MALKELEALSSSIVVVPATEGAISVSGADMAQIIKDPTTIQLPDGIHISSLRDQAVIIVAGGRLQFVSQSGQEPVGNRLPEIVDGFLRVVASQGIDKFRFYGLNYDIAFDCRGDLTAAQTISDAFVDTRIINSKAGIEVRGAGLHLFFNHAEATCTLKLEPRLGEISTPRMYASINYTYDVADSHMPPLEDLKLKYHGLWGHFKEVLERLLG